MSYSRLNPGDLVILDDSYLTNTTFFDDDDCSNDTKFFVGDVAIVIGPGTLFPKDEVRVLFKLKTYIAHNRSLKKMQA